MDPRIVAVARELLTFEGLTAAEQDAIEAHARPLVAIDDGHIVLDPATVRAHEAALLAFANDNWAHVVLWHFAEVVD